MANRMASWLQKQRILIAKMWIKCPKLTTRWFAVRRLTNFLLGISVGLFQLIVEKGDPNKTPYS
uniref:Uncharacterized protein n=1 Tax=Peronospora matthiolae TaxID=2874970 RepID=A0AAV1TUK6_9STRA